MSRWPGCGGAAESRRGKVASILRETEQKTAIHTLNQSEPSSLIIGSVHMSKSGVEETSVSWCFFNLFGVLIPIDQGNNIALKEFTAHRIKCTVFPFNSPIMFYSFYSPVRAVCFHQLIQ